MWRQKKQTQYHKRNTRLDLHKSLHQATWSWIYNNHKKWYTKTISVQEYSMMQQRANYYQGHRRVDHQARMQVSSKAASFIWLQSTIGDKIQYNYEKLPNDRKHSFPGNKGNKINIALEANYIHLVRCTDLQW